MKTNPTTFAGSQQQITLPSALQRGLNIFFASFSQPSSVANLPLSPSPLAIFMRKMANRLAYMPDIFPFINEFFVFKVDFKKIVIVFTNFRGIFWAKLSGKTKGFSGLSCWKIVCREKLLNVELLIFFVKSWWKCSLGICAKIRPYFLPKSKALFENISILKIF